MFAVGEKVRLKNNPSVVGVITESDSIERAGRRFTEVELASGRQFFPLSQLEALSAAPDALVDLRAGKLSAPIDLRRALTHLRMTGRLADIIYSMGSTNTDFLAYQFKPVLKLLNSPSRGLLIADEVGLGKTIEAGLVWTELVARFNSRRLLIVCPKSLVQKWREELRNKFNINAQICDARDLLETLRDDRVRREGFAVIASISSLRPPRKWNDADKPATGTRADLATQLSDAEDDLFDLVIFDEAHHLRNTNTTNHRLGQLLTNVSDYSLFLSATPINLRANDLRALLKLIDPDTFDREFLFEMLQEENAPLIRAWEAAKNPRVPLNDVAELIDDLPEGQVLKTGKRLELLRSELERGIDDTPTNRIKLAARLEEMSLLGSIINRTRRRDVAEFKVERRPQTAVWSMTGEERSFYDAATEQIATYALEHDVNEQFLLAGAQRLLASSLATAYRTWGSRSGYLDLDDDDEETAGNQIPGPLIAALGEVCDNAAVLRALEEKDRKLQQLLEWLKDIRNRDSSQRVIIFSSFRKTLDYLSRRLADAGYSAMALHGGIKADRQETVSKFSDSPGGTILLTSEVGGEGLDLQFCRILINWDLPWNPMKVEQRIGRIDRIGQQSPSIDIINLIAEDTIEQKVYDRLYVRLGIIQETLGDFEPILGEIIRDIELCLLDPELTEEQREARLDQSILAAEQRKIQAEELEREAPGLVAHGDSILHRIEEAQAPFRRLTADDLHDYISGALTSLYDGTRILPTGDDRIDAYEIRLSPMAQAEFSTYRANNARRYPTLFARDGTSGVRVVFGSNPDPVRFRLIEPVPMAHPLARFCAERIEARQVGLAPRPASSFRARNRPEWAIPNGRYVIAVEQWAFTGIMPIKRLAFSGGRPADGIGLSEDQAEQILMESLAEGPALFAQSPDAAIEASEFVEMTLRPILEERRKNFEDSEAARHFDHADTQLALIAEHKERETNRVQALSRELRFSGNTKKMQSAFMHEGKLKNFLARMDLKLAEISERREELSFFEPILVSIAIVDIEGQTNDE